MVSLDMDRLPTGQTQWCSLIKGLLAAGNDRYEGHHLELKSEVDMSTKSGRGKIAKFILATANRPPELAASRFGGYAVMLIGLDYTSTPASIASVAKFDDKDLRREVTNFVGEPGPGWDYQRIDVDGSEVIAVIVEPPEPAAMWPCQRDGDAGIKNGLIYLRTSAETKPATGSQIAAMVDRLRSSQPNVDIDVEISGNVWAIRFDHAGAIAHIQDEAKNLRATFPITPTSAATSGIGFPYGQLSSMAMSGFAGRNDSRSKSDFYAEIDDYETAAIEAIDDVFDAVVAAAPGFSVRVTNKTMRSLDDVEVIIHIDPPFDVLDHDDEAPGDLMPERPREWGPEPLSVFGPRQPPYLPPIANPALDSGMRLVERSDDGLDLVFDVGQLRPLATVEAGEEFVLTLPGDYALTPMRARWSMTARDVHEVFTGEVSPVAVSQFDASGRVADHVVTELRNRS